MYPEKLHLQVKKIAVCLKWADFLFKRVNMLVSCSGLTNAPEHSLNSFFPIHKVLLQPGQKTSSLLKKSRQKIWVGSSQKCKWIPNIWNMLRVEMQIKTTPRYHFSSFKSAKQKNVVTPLPWSHSEIGIVIHFPFRNTYATSADNSTRGAAPTHVHTSRCKWNTNQASVQTRCSRPSPHPDPPCSEVWPQLWVLPSDMWVDDMGTCTREPVPLL